MSAILIHNRQNPGSVSVPASFITEYMPEANGEYIKVYLSLLHAVQNNHTLSISTLADTLNDTERDIMRALRYWAQHGLLALIFDEESALTAVELLPFPEHTPQQQSPPRREDRTGRSGGVPASAVQEAPLSEPAPAQALPSETSPQTDSAPRPSASAVDSNDDLSLEQLNSNEEFKTLLYVTEQYLGYSLSSAATERIVYFYNLFHSFDTVEYLIEYCVSSGHTDLRYIEATALAWHKERLTTREAIEQSRRQRTAKDYERRVMEQFGLKNAPAPVQSEFISRWRDIYHFPVETVLLACDRTVKKTGGQNFEYADRILSDWYRRRLRTPEEIAAGEKQLREEKRAAQTAALSAAVTPTPAKRTAFHNFQQHDYSSVDLDAVVFGYTKKN